MCVRVGDARDKHMSRLLVDVSRTASDNVSEENPPWVDVCVGGSLTLWNVCPQNDPSPPKKNLKTFLNELE